MPVNNLVGIVGKLSQRNKPSPLANLYLTPVVPPVPGTVYVCE